VKGVIQEPWPTVALLHGGPHSDLAAALQVDRAHPQMLARPANCLNVGAGLDRDVVLDSDQIKRPGKVSIMSALKVLSHACAELLQRESSKRRAAIHGIQRHEAELLHLPLNQIRRCILLHLG
jgi:hypothetical protein